MTTLRQAGQNCQTDPKATRVARMLAFGHKVCHRSKEVQSKGQTDAARQLVLTWTRVSQLLDSTRMALDTQEKILFFVRVVGIEPLIERILRQKIWEAYLLDQRMGD